MGILDFFRITPKKRNVKIKKRSGIIYHNPSGFKRHFFYFGNGVLIAAFMAFIYLYYPLGKALFVYRFHSKQEETKFVSFPQDMPVTDYSIQIPKILASAKVVTDVSPFDSKEYLKVLNEDVIAQAKDSSEPGSGNGNMTYLFAHSSEENIGMVRKNPVFYLLGQLKNGDLIYLKYKDKIYTYKTYMKKVIGPSEIQYLNYKDENKEVVILQTCWPIGTDWNRLLVFAERI